MDQAPKQMADREKKREDEKAQSSISREGKE